ncbi:decapping and exoribonuclease protein-like [Paramacrobiotus metropolitanus]|uniref:decapping and exoribonuclease protein-like n=1 Tax=Paramacrobiotus metropolitanus TaxID=2943436 RepID=UPI0024456E61|nr:decapping and exoribonuclease protein-like [Paramacrobiotus metropolitanus]
MAALADKECAVEKLSGLAMQLGDFQGASCSIAQPVEIGAFTLTGPWPATDPYQRQFHDDRSGLPTLQRRGAGQAVVKGLSLPLDKGFRSFVSRQEPRDPAQRDHLNHLLQWIIKHPADFLQYKAQTDVVCWRGHLHTVMSTPYESAKFCTGWIICACRIDGVIYLSHFDTASKAADKEIVDEKQAHFIYWGYKFEQYMTHPADDKAAFEEPVNNFHGFHAVLKGQVGATGLLFGAEMDCLDPLKKDAPPPRCYVELKTARRPDTQRQWQSHYNHKMCKIWAQSFVSGVPTVLIGYRDDAGNCVSTEEMPVARISKLAKEYGNSWSGGICLNFLDGFLRLVKRSVTEDYRHAVYKFEWNPGWDRVTAEKWPAHSQWQFIPDWYLEKRPR